VLGGPPGRDDYLTGHIPGAAFVDLETELAGPAGTGGRHPLPGLETFQAAMRRAGVDQRGSVVVYDATGGLAAARAWWLLRYFGHPKVSVLDGGLTAWTAAGHPLQGGPEEAPEGDFQARAGAMPMLDAGGAAALARRGVLLDARAPERFRGDHEPIDPVAGHIPGAVNLPTAQNLDGSGRFLDADRLRGRFATAGIRPEVEVGAYCGSGVTAAHEVLALEVAGFPGAALYPGSWSEWVIDPARPVATGAEPG
jgi:thiosulfate/3-mercaptopyruvate sulfurtransferase